MKKLLTGMILSLILSTNCTTQHVKADNVSFDNSSIVSNKGTSNQGKSQQNAIAVSNQSSDKAIDIKKKEHYYKVFEYLTISILLFILLFWILLS